MNEHAYLADTVMTYPGPARDLNPIDPLVRSTRINLGPLVSPEMALERAIRGATRQNAEQHSSHGHEPAPLYGMAEYCGHTNPETLAAAEGLDDLIEAEHQRRHPGDTWRTEGYDERSQSVRQSFVIAQLLDAMEFIYDDGHTNYVCLADPQGYACVECDRDALEDGEGVESSGCRRISDSRETWDEFWYFQGDLDNRFTAQAEAQL